MQELDRNEVVYRTHLELGETLSNLKGTPGLRIEDDNEARPPGIAQLYWKGASGEVSCRIGAKGGVQIHYLSEEDLSRLVDMLKSKGSYHDDDHRWTKTNELHGRSYWVTLAVDTTLALSHLLSQQMPPIQAWNLVFPSTMTEEERAAVEEEVEKNSVSFVAEPGTGIERIVAANYPE